MHVVFVSEPEVVSTGMDWITMTTTEGTATKEMMTYAKEFSDKEFSSELGSKEWSGMGYRGSQIGGLRWGTRNKKEGIIILSGPWASKMFYGTEELQRRVTRMDLEVTVLLKKAVPTAARFVYNALLKENEYRTRPRYIKLISSPTGDTVYVGKRNGNVMLRFYDKSFDLGEDRLGIAWRFEVEYKGAASRKMAEAVSETEQMFEAITCHVLGEYQKRSIFPNFRPGNSVSAIQIGAKISTAVTKLHWLTKCVAPVVSQLVLAGYGNETLTALNLRGIAKQRSG